LGFCCLVLAGFLFSLAPFLGIFSFKEVVGGRFSWLIGILGYNIENKQKGEGQDTTRTRMVQRYKCHFKTGLQLNRLSHCESGPKSKLGKSAVFEIGTFDLAGASFETGATKQAPRLQHFYELSEFTTNINGVIIVMDPASTIFA